VTGSLRRQRQTAAWASANGAPTRTDPAWNEYDDRDVLSHHSDTAARVDRPVTATGQKLTSREYQVLVDAALQRWVDAGESRGCEETWPQFLRRTGDALARVAAELGRGQTGLVFSSGGVIAALAVSLTSAGGQAFVPLHRIAVNTGVTKLIFGGRGGTLVSYNEHGHLDEAGGSLTTYR
jgi:broad specificity phosphatase PhoE